MRYWWAERVNVWLWATKIKRNILMTSCSGETVCLPEERAYAGEHTTVIHVNSSAAYNTCGQFIKTGSWLGLQIYVCKCRSLSTLMNTGGACMGWKCPYTGKGPLFILPAPLRSLWQISLYQWGEFFLLLHFVKWSKAPSFIHLILGFYSQVFPTRWKKHPFNKNVATHMLTPGDGQWAKLPRTKQQLGLIKS